MSEYEYKVISAPTRGARGRGIKGAEGRFAFSLELTMNQMAAEGWEYQRAETLPSEERSGLSSQTVYRSILVFRRRRSGDLSAFDPRYIDTEAPAPLLLPTPDTPADTGMEDEVPADDHGLSALLKRRAARLSETPPAPVDNTPPAAPVARQEPQDTMPAIADAYEDESEDWGAPSSTLPLPRTRPMPTKHDAPSRPDPDLAASLYGTDTLEFHDRAAAVSRTPRSAAK
ncbi:DUF4177 domain-containing protein [Pseudooceanicola nitratireducens]|uniref:DUF4177 domain-containing protein n=1 Tax=Pseudooceanicola nitratireducens TaxID=517719 RepID=UPI0030B8FECB